MVKFKVPPTEIVLHHSASNRESVDAAEIRQWHLERGFEDIGYHWVITRKGLIQTGRDRKYKGAHCKAAGKNTSAYGICLVGDSTKKVFTDAQIQALRYLLAYINRTEGRDLLISQHSDWEKDKPFCAGFTPEQLKEFNNV